MIEKNQLRFRVKRCKTTVSTPQHIIEKLNSFHLPISNKSQDKKQNKKQYPSNRQQNQSNRIRISLKSSKNTTNNSTNNKFWSFHLMNNRNNEQLVARLLLERGVWRRNEGRLTNKVDLIWGYINDYKMNELSSHQMLSRLSNSNELTNKGQLYKNIEDYCCKHDINLNFLPITFYFRSNRKEIQEFIDLFLYLKEFSLLNIWLVKPTHLNQGRNIILFKQVTQLLSQFQFEMKREINLDEQLTESQLLKHKEIMIKYLWKYLQKYEFKIIFQKYIEYPLLINQYKFDIRIWVLVNQQDDYFVFEQGYLRFTNEEYALNQHTIHNRFMHLTNHAVQKYNHNYSKDHTIQPVSVLANYLALINKPHQFELIMQKINQIIKLTFKAGLQKTQAKKNHAFQIFGYDFLIDRELNVRLIEVNCNPALTLDCELLKQMIPKMINDAFKLTIDKLYRPKTTPTYLATNLKLHNSWIHLGNRSQR